METLKYLDNMSTTEILPEALEQMVICLKENMGNPDSPHPFGWNAKNKVEMARKSLAKIINAKSKEITFTSGATESINLALKGLFFQYGKSKNQIISSPIEHKATLNTLDFLKSMGAEIFFLKLDSQGKIDLKQLKSLINDKTLCVSLLHANNEIGNINPIREVGEICKAADVFFHVDAAQSFAKLPIDVELDNISLLSLSAHKFHGPKGIGALYTSSKSPRVKLTPLLHGGGQELGLRAGTLNVASIVAMECAATIISNNRNIINENLLNIRKQFFNFIENNETLKNKIKMNVTKEDCLLHLYNFEILTNDISKIKSALREFAFSSGSACSSMDSSASHVLSQIGLTENQAKNSIRLALSQNSNWSDLEEFLIKLEMALNN